MIFMMVSVSKFQIREFIDPSHIVLPNQAFGINGIVFGYNIATAFKFARHHPIIKREVCFDHSYAVFEMSLSGELDSSDAIQNQSEAYYAI